MDTQSFLHNSTRQETIDNPPRWAVGRRSKVTCSDVSESSSFTPESNSIKNKYIQTDVPARYIAQRPIDSRVNVLSFVSNVQPPCAFNILQMVLRCQGIICYQSSIYQKVLSGIKPRFCCFPIENLLLAMNMMMPRIISIR